MKEGDILFSLLFFAIISIISLALKGTIFCQAYSPFRYMFMITKICSRCRKPMSRSESDGKRESWKFCSRKCMSESGRIKIKCLLCKKEVLQFKCLTKKLCSPKCAGIHKATKRLEEQKKRIECNRKVCKLRVRNFVVLFDKEELEVIKTRRWFLNRGYIISNDIRMHQLILGVKYGYHIDHINGIKTDNRKSNLRYVLPFENSINTGLSRANKTGRKGVALRRNGYQATIRHKNDIKYKYFRTFKEAVKCREEWEKEFGFDKLQDKKRISK